MRRGGGSVIAADLYVIVFRIVHVMAAIAWGGSVFLFVLFVAPSAAAIGPEAGPFMRELLGRRRLVRAILTMATVTIVGGAFLYWHDAQAAGGLGDWLGSTYGLWLTIGSVAAIAAFSIGLLGTRPNVDRMLALAARIAQAGGDAPEDLIRQLQRIQARLRALARTSLGLIAIAAFAMATARYW